MAEETGGDCKEFQLRIHKLTKMLDNPDLYRAIVRRMDYLEELDRLDLTTRFQLHSDQDGKTTLKFDTPEEKIVDRINSIKNYIAWIGGFQTAAVDQVAKHTLDAVEKLQNHVNRKKIKELTKKGNFEDIVVIYRQLKNSRLTAMENLNNLADRSLCFGITIEHLELARLYHDTIPLSSGCEKIQKKHLLDLIERDQPPGFSPFLDKKTYLKVKASCRNIGKTDWPIVPKLKGMRLPQAKRTLNAMDLSMEPLLLKSAPKSSDAGRIYKQNPKKYSKIKPEGSVKVWVYGKYKHPKKLIKKCLLLTFRQPCFHTDLKKTKSFWVVKVPTSWADGCKGLLVVFRIRVYEK